MNNQEQIDLVTSKLLGSPNEWQVKVLHLIQQVPSVYLISYGNLAHWANQQYGLSLNPRNTAWLRGKIYGIIGHDTDIPLHRIANQDDVESTKDHPFTQEVNRKKRTSEGSYPKAKWLAK